jgi:hypothetical protein
MEALRLGVWFSCQYFWNTEYCFALGNFEKGSSPTVGSSLESTLEWGGDGREGDARSRVSVGTVYSLPALVELCCDLPVFV